MDLTADEKATISAIAGLTGAATGATVGGSMADVVQGNQAGQIAVDNNTVLGDKIRSLIEDAKEYWHTEKEAKDHLDVIRNIAVNTIGDTLDGAVGITDYSIDTLNAVVYCLGVTPDLCNQMHATLDPKNEAVLNTFKAAFDSRTYVQFYELVNRAAHGDLQAREAAGEMLAGILIAKKFGNVSKAGKGTVVNKPLGLGSTGRNIPANLNEKLALEQAISNPNAGRQLPVPMTDKRWPASDGWVKMSQNINGIEVHYVRNVKTGAIDHFKFK